VLLVVAATFAADAATPIPKHDVLITDDRSGDTYVRSDGQSSAITDLCGSSRQSQEEPSVAVDPHDADVIAVGANDGCGTRFRSQWMGVYRSGDGGETWTHSLVPGFVQDTSEDGAKTPVHGTCGFASDPALAFDRDGTLFYEFICAGESNLGEPALFVARYADDGERFAGMAAVRRADSSGFEDKPSLAVDVSGSTHDGSVYTVWTDYGIFGGGPVFCHSILFARSTDGGRSFQRATPVSTGACGVGADVAVGPHGGVYVVYRNERTILITSSADGGETFSRPVAVATILPNASTRFSSGGMRECGDGPAKCANGRTFPRADTLPAVAADADGVHVVWTGRDERGTGRVYVKTSVNGRTWSRRAVEVRPVDAGHQWMPDIASDGDHLAVVFLDSREDPAFEPWLPPGQTDGGANSGDVVHTFLERSVDGGVTWVEEQLSHHGSNPNWEVSGAARVPFYGDYLSVAISGGHGFAAWPDSRDVVPGTDPRETGADDDHDGFDVYLPCTWIPDDIDVQFADVSNGACLTAGGMDLNVYGASFEP
jgi:hypothetical protein